MVLDTQNAAQKGQKAEGFAVEDFILRTIPQNATKLARGAFPVTCRLTASKDKKRMKTVLVLALVGNDMDWPDDDMDWPDNENRVHGKC